jgi:hypothetical protein
MKLEKLLAENMLRFGTKNVLAKHVKPYLMEQTATYTADPLYKELYALLGDQSKLAWDGKKPGKNGQPITDEDRAALLTSFKEKIAKKQQVTGKDQSKVLKSIESVTITSKPGEAKAIAQKEPTRVEHVFTAVYPDNQTANPELQNFFLNDNIVEVSETATEEFKKLITDLISSVPKDQTITRILVYAGSSTSQVPTTYGMPAGTRYKTIEEGQKNNVTLANARYDVVVNKLSELVKQLVPQFTGQIEIEPKSTSNVKPNNGPAYTTKEQQYFFSTGKLNPALKDKYEKLYGPFKGSYGGVTVYTEGSMSIVTTPEDETQVTQNWMLSITPKRITADTSKPKKFAGGKGITIYNGVPKLDCPVW